MSDRNPGSRCTATSSTTSFGAGRTRWATRKRNFWRARVSWRIRPSDIFGIFSDADFPYPTVTLSDGKTVKLDASAYELYRAAPNREDRQKVMAAFFEALGKYRGTFGALMNANDQASSVLCEHP